MPGKDKTLKHRFLRYEFKYYFTSKQRHDIESELQHFMQLDPFVEDHPNKKYFVRSLYFDAPNLVAYDEKTDGIKFRNKFRLRTYSEDTNGGVPIFLEQKGRVNNYVFKERSILPENLQDILKNGVTREFLKSVLRTSLSRIPKEVFQKFLFQVLYLRLQPVVLVDYYRRPYVSRYDLEFRLTFDDSLHGMPTSRLFPRRSALRRRLIPGYTILEIKFLSHIPAWFHRLIRTYDLERFSLSKYCLGLNSTGLVKNREKEGSH